MQLTLEQYINSELKYEDGFLLDSYDNVIMSTYEESIMEVAANVVANKGGDILNVGFGLGVVDHFIQLKKPKSHTIIEPHKQLFNEAQKNGWDKIEMLNECWTSAVDNFIKEGRKFDGIYFDTYTYDSHNETLDKFILKLKHILKKDGVFSYFLNWDSSNVQRNINDFAKEDIYIANLINLNVEYDDEKLENRNGYTIRKDHYVPIVRFKNISK